ncbi:MAG: baseplate J/gp47 family protein [Bacteroidales bacterium]|nr:baseplate J/gp47 family protein [Bacteroidales bacterium]
MADSELLRFLNSLPGQSQSGRFPLELEAHYADIEERNAAELLEFSSRLSEYINFYRHQTELPEGDWSAFFPHGKEEIDVLLDSPDGKITPHLALFMSFLRLYESGPKRLINEFTARHLAFYYKDVLRLTKNPEEPDHVHLVIEPRKNSPSFLLGQSNLFTAGKDGKGKELIYKPVRDTVIGNAKIESLRSIFYQQDGKGSIHHAPVANSLDGMGEKLSSEDTAWPAFGKPGLPILETGFAFASPVLRMKEGNRSIELEIQLDSLGEAYPEEESLHQLFEVYLTAEKGWTGPYIVSPSWKETGRLQVKLTVPATEKAIVDYLPEIHGGRFAASAPIIQLLLRQPSDEQTSGYNDLKDLVIRKASIQVYVTGIKQLELENDLGKLDPKKPFAPFGQQATAGSSLKIGCEEALSKNLTAISISLEWKNPPANLGTHYQAYGMGISNSSFTMSSNFSTAFNKNYRQSSLPLFDSGNATRPIELDLMNGETISSGLFINTGLISALKLTESLWAKPLIRRIGSSFPTLIFQPLPSQQSQPGKINLTLRQSFLHAEYLKKSVEKVVNYVKDPDAPQPFAALNEPYSPVLSQLLLSYKASSGEVEIFSATAESYSNDALGFFHLAYGGQMREHAFQHAQLSFSSPREVKLLPTYSKSGELLIGFSEIQPGDSVSILFQLAEGSEDPDIPHSVPEWSILSDNYWMPLDFRGVVLDTTDQLRKSGIIRFVIPTDASTSHTLLTPGLIWLKAGISGSFASICKVTGIFPNALEAAFINNDNDPEHLDAPLEKNRISKLKISHPHVKSIVQPFNSFGGKKEELEKAFNTRVSERLRHKNRSISSWDYERMVLQQFAEVHKVKAIPHSRYFEDSGKFCWMAPGHVLLIVIPDLRNKNAVNPLQPKVNSETLHRIDEFLHQHSGMQVQLRVKNPRYQTVKVECKVKFRNGFEFNFYSIQMNQAIREYLSPWAYGQSGEIDFGGRLYKSVLLNFIEELTYVDYIEELFIYTETASGSMSDDQSVIEGITPDSILVSAADHKILEAK